MHRLINEQALPEKVVLGLPKTTLKISDFLEVLTGLRKFVIFTVIDYYRKRIQLKFAKDKDTWTKFKRNQAQASRCFLQLHGDVLDSPDSSCEVLLNREDHLALGEFLLEMSHTGSITSLSEFN